MTKNNSLSIHQNTNFLNQQTLESAYRLAVNFHKSGCFNETIKNAEQALTVLIAGAESGLKPAESMNAFYMIKGSLQMYGSALSKVLSRNGIEIKFNKLSKTEVDIDYIEDGQIVQNLKYTIQDLPNNSKAKVFAPEEKLVYHAHSRFLRYNDVGGSIPYTDYDQGVIEANSKQHTDPPIEAQAETKHQDPKLKELERFIMVEAQTVEALERIKSEIENYPELYETLNSKIEELQNNQ